MKNTKKLIVAVSGIAAMIGCSTIEKETPKFKAGEIITLKAGVSLNNTKVQPIDISKDTVTFKWEDGDKVTICNEGDTSIFTVVSSSINGGNADFTGEALSDMSSYDVYYNYDGDTSKVHRVNYIKDSFKPFINGSGNENGFVLDEFLPVLNIGIISFDDPSLTVGRICYYAGRAQEESMSAEDHHSRPLRTELIFENGLELSCDDVIQVYFPISCVSNSSGFTIDFFDTDGELFDADPDSTWSDYRYMAPEINLSNYMNKIVSFNKPLEACLAAGTLVTMADGSVKKIEDIVTGDYVGTFDHEKGILSSSEVCLTYKGKQKACPLILSFSSGKKLSIVGTHDLLEETTLKYVRINNFNIKKYVGRRFYNAESGCWDTLTGYEHGKAADYYCIYSAYHINCIADGMLTCPDDVDFCLNIYELDKNLKADAALLAADIAAYGLFDMNRRFPEYASDPAFSYTNSLYRYSYLAIGKGLITREELLAMISEAVTAGM